MSFVPVIVGISAIGVTVLIFWKFKSGSKMNLSTMAAKNLRGKIAVITGASSGIGREVAYQLAKLQVDVILACRDRVKGQQAVEFIENRLKSDIHSTSTASNTGAYGNLHLLDLDLSDLRSVDAFAEEFGRRFDSLHLLINNAGIMACPFMTSHGGTLELQFATNHLGHFHLTNLLLPTLRRSAPSRILIVSSGQYRKLARGLPPAEILDATTLFEAVYKEDPSHYDALKAYSRSKLANCLHGLQLSKQLPDNQIGVYVIRPGFIRGTELGRYFNRILTVLAKPLIWLFSRTVEQAAQTYLHCALTDMAELKSGSLYHNCHLEPYLENLVNEKNADVLWKLSERYVKEEDILKSK